MGRQILAIDDNEIVGWTLAARLWVAGYDVETVSNVGEAFIALQQKQYDLILMDLEMPDMTGLEALERLRAEGLCPETPVVLLTSSEDFRHVQAAHALGARGYLTKGSAASALMKNIDRLMTGDEVVWIDDEHSVAKLAQVDQDRPVLVSTPMPEHLRKLPPMIRLVASREDPQPATLGGR